MSDLGFNRHIGKSNATILKEMRQILSSGRFDPEKRFWSVMEALRCLDAYDENEVVYDEVARRRVNRHTKKLRREARRAADRESTDAAIAMA